MCPDGDYWNGVNIFNFQICNKKKQRKKAQSSGVGDGGGELEENVTVISSRLSDHIETLAHILALCMRVWYLIYSHILLQRGWFLNKALSLELKHQSCSHMRSMLFSPRSVLIIEFPSMTI